MEQKRAKPRLDRWFLLVIAMMIWTLIMQVTSLGAQLAVNLADFYLWCRTIASVIALFGIIWVFRIYLSTAVNQARQIKALEEALKDQPEVKEIVINILKGQTK